MDDIPLILAGKNYKRAKLDRIKSLYPNSQCTIDGDRLTYSNEHGIYFEANCTLVARLLEDDNVTEVIWANDAIIDAIPEKYKKGVTITDDKMLEFVMSLIYSKFDYVDMGPTQQIGFSGPGRECKSATPIFGLTDGIIHDLEARIDIFAEDNI